MGYGVGGGGEGCLPFSFPQDQAGEGQSEVACWQVYQLVEVHLRTRALSPSRRLLCPAGIPPWFPGGVPLDKGKAEVWEDGLTGACPWGAGI